MLRNIPVELSKVEMREAKSAGRSAAWLGYPISSLQGKSKEYKTVYLDAYNRKKIEMENRHISAFKNYGAHRGSCFARRIFNKHNGDLSLCYEDLERSIESYAFKHSSTMNPADLKEFQDSYRQKCTEVLEDMSLSKKGIKRKNRSDEPIVSDAIMDVEEADDSQVVSPKRRRLHKDTDAAQALLDLSSTLPPALSIPTIIEPRLSSMFMAAQSPQFPLHDWSLLAMYPWLMFSLQQHPAFLETTIPLQLKPINYDPRLFGESTTELKRIEIASQFECKL
jgi:hypothetical protein